MFPKRYQKSVTKLSFPLRQLCHSVYSQSFQKYALMKVLKMIRFMRTFMRIFLLRISEIILKLIHLKNVLQTPISPKSYKKLYLVSLRCLRLKPCCSALTTRPPKGAGEDPFRPRCRCPRTWASTRSFDWLSRLNFRSAFSPEVGASTFEDDCRTRQKLVFFLRRRRGHGQILADRTTKPGPSFQL